MSKKKVLLRGVFINRDTNGEGVLKVGTTLIRVSTVMGILYRRKERGSNKQGQNSGKLQDIREDIQRGCEQGNRKQICSAGI